MKKRNKGVTIYVTEKEKEDLFNKAKECGLSVSDYIRLLIKRRKI